MRCAAVVRHLPANLSPDDEPDTLRLHPHDGLQEGGKITIEEESSGSLTWSGTATVSPILASVVAFFLLALLGTLSRAGDWRIAALAVALTSTIFLVFCSVRLEVSELGVWIRLGPLGFPRSFRRLEDIEEARVLRVNPLRFGGWGYRLIGGGSAVIVRGGEAIELRMKGSRRLVVTVDGAGDAARTINELLAEHN